MRASLPHPLTPATRSTSGGADARHAPLPGVEVPVGAGLAGDGDAGPGLPVGAAPGAGDGAGGGEEYVELGLLTGNTVCSGQADTSELAACMEHLTGKHSNMLTLTHKNGRTDGDLSVVTNPMDVVTNVTR